MALKHTLARHALIVALYWAVIYLLSSFIVSLFTVDPVWDQGPIMYMTLAGSGGLGILCYVNGWIQENRHTTMIAAARNVNGLAAEVSEGIMHE